MDKETLNRLYETETYYWGTEASGLAKRIPGFLGSDGTGKPAQGLRALDLGAGEGRDSVYLASLGYGVTAFDWAEEGLRKARRLAEGHGVEIETVTGDMNDGIPAGRYDLVYSIGALQYIRPELRNAAFERMAAATNGGGLHVLFAFTEVPEIPPSHDWAPNEYFYRPGELEAYYSTGWDVLHTRLYTFDCSSGGVPHRHAATELIVRKKSP